MKVTWIAIITTALAGSFSGISAEEKAVGQDQAQPATKAASVFSAIDADADGKITPKELADSRRFQDAGKGEVSAAFKEKDLNGDGGISAHEFTKTFRTGDEAHGHHHGKGGPEKGRVRGRSKGKVAGKGKA